MPTRDFGPAYSFFSALSAAPLRPLHALVRTTEERFRPPQVELHRPVQARAQAAVLGRLPPEAAHRATIRREAGAGRVPTIVLGGLVPDASEQVFLLRRCLLRSGDVYYVNYPRAGFPLDLVCAQLDDLVAELAAAGQPPVIFAVSFGAGIALECLRRVRSEGREPLLAGIVLVSPVTCVADLVAPGAAKPSTLLGRALQPYLAAEAPVPEITVEKSRALFLRMFEAGAQNRQALRAVMTAQEAGRLRAAVVAAIRAVTSDGARQRAQAIAALLSPTEYFSPAILPLNEAPALVLFAECEDAVLDRNAPVRFALERLLRAYFPEGAVHCVRAKPGAPKVQHASLIFHAFEFLPRIQAFYQRLRRGPLAFAA